MKAMRIQQDRSLFVGLLFAFLLTAFASKAFAQTSAVTPTVRAPLLAYVQETARGTFELRLHDPAGKSSEAVATMADRPALLVWRTDRPEVITVLSDTSYSTAYLKKPHVSIPIGEQSPKGLELIDGWIGKDGKSLMVMGAAGGGGANPASSCVLYQVPSTGPWRKAEEEKASASGSDAPCEAFANRHRVTSFSMSTTQLMNAYQCASKASVCASIGDKRYEAAGVGMVKAGKDLDAAAFADPGKTPFFLGFGVRTGDAPHLMGPARVLQRDGRPAKPTTLKVPTQVQVAIKGPLILVAEEYSGDNPTLFDANTGQVVLSTRRASSAVWVP
jgi:hypothetical protein